MQFGFTFTYLIFLFQKITWNFQSWERKYSPAEEMDQSGTVGVYWWWCVHTTTRIVGDITQNSCEGTTVQATLYIISLDVCLVKNM